jgi:hypothetical protein
VFGVLNMLVSVASFLPILVVGPIADLLGTTIVILIVAILIVASGIASIYLRGPLRAVERDSRATVGTDRDPFVTALGVEPHSGGGFDGEPIAHAGAESTQAAGPAPAGSVVAEVVNPITVTAVPIEPVGVTGEPVAESTAGVDAADRDPSG